MTPAPSPPSAPSSPPAAWTARELAVDPHQIQDKAVRVQRMFAAIARSYDLNNRVHSFGRDQAWRRRLVAMCDLKSADRVLDVACGTGDLAEAFAAAGATSVIGVDFTQPMLDLAERKAACRLRGTGTARPTYRWADAMDLPFADGAFDIVSIAFGIRNVADPDKALAEFHRVLRPGGRVAILEFSRPRSRLLRLVNSIYCDRIMPLTATLLARDRSGAYRYLPRSVQTFAQPEALSDMLSQAGFQGPRQLPLTFGICTATVAYR